jgi:hypothetical protein
MEFGLMLKSKGRAADEVDALLLSKLLEGFMALFNVDDGAGRSAIEVGKSYFSVDAYLQMGLATLRRCFRIHLLSKL